MSRDAASRDNPPAAATVIDTHTHFWDTRRARPPGRNASVPFPAPNDTVLYHPALPADYETLARPLGITGTVVVEASGWLEDNDWILALAESNKLIVGFIGNFGEVWNDRAKFDAALAKYGANPVFRGIRVGRGQVTTAASSTENFRRLAAADLAVEVNGVPFADIEALAARVPTLRIVVDHMGYEFRPQPTPDPAWVAGIQLIAQRPNVTLKVSGLLEATGTRNAPTDLDVYRPALDVVWMAFGADRLVFGSNWPVCNLGGTLGAAHQIVKRYFAEKGAEAESKFFAGNARRVYKWQAPR